MIQSNFPVGDSTATKNHINNGDIHVTAAQKTEWSNKQDAIGLSVIDGKIAMTITKED